MSKESKDFESVFNDLFGLSSSKQSSRPPRATSSDTPTRAQLKEAVIEAARAWRAQLKPYDRTHVWEEVELVRLIDLLNKIDPPSSDK